MDYVCPINDVEQQLKEAGKQLSVPPSSTKDLLDLLDKIEKLLTFVGQAPSLSMQRALLPSMGALIADELLRHPDVDVRVSVASCHCEIARITAPEPPYKDEIMKEIFELHVMAFGNLSNMSGRNYYKATHILKSFAKVKACLLMLDLECNALVVEMFDQFLSSLRTNHPHTVFSHMETIMSLVIEESDEIDTELLSLLLSSVRKEKQNVSPMPWKLAEKVLKNCNDTLKSYSQVVMEIISSDSDNYAEVVASLCENAYENQLSVTESAVADSIHGGDDNTLENGGSTKTLLNSQPKKQRYTDTQRLTVVCKRRERKPDTISSKEDDGYDENRLKGKELEASQNLSSPHESLSTEGRSNNEKNNLNEDTRPDLVHDSNSTEDMLRAQFQDKVSHSKELPLTEKSKIAKGSEGKPDKGSAKSKGIAKRKIKKTSGALNSLVITHEDEPLSDSGRAEALGSQLNDKKGGRRKSSSKKYVASGSRHKDVKDACNLKEYGEELVGCRVNVWWPLDKTFYEGVVEWYDPLDKKHKVLYVDGDEEILDLRDEKWKILDDISPDQQQEQIPDPPSPTTTSVKSHGKKKRKRKMESSSKPQKHSNSPKSSQVPADSLNKPTKEHKVGGTNASTTNTLCDADNHQDDLVQILNIRSGQKSTEKPDTEGPKTIEMEQDGKCHSSSIATEEHISSQVEPNSCGESETVKTPDFFDAKESSETKKTAKKRRRLVTKEKVVSET